MLVTVTEEIDINGSCDSGIESENSSNESETESKQSINIKSNSNKHHTYKSLIEQQSKDSDLKWIKELLLKHGDNIPQSHGLTTR